MQELFFAIQKAHTIAITGHVHPDGDCIGSCLGLQQYIMDNYQDKKVQVYLEPIAPEFYFLPGADAIKNEEDDIIYDLFFVLDSSSKDRFSPFSNLFENAKKTFCIDHHVTNLGICDTQMIDSKASATCEIMCDILDMEKISLACAQCLYTGIVHDTGVFKHSNTRKKTMYFAGDLLDKGVDSTSIIDGTFYQKTFVQNKMLGQALLNSKLYHNGQINVAYLTLEDMKKIGGLSSDTNGIIDQLRITEGVRVSVFLYALNDHTYKVSMRSSDGINVADISAEFQGGGHVKAAGFSYQGTIDEILHILLPKLEGQL